MGPEYNKNERNSVAFQNSIQSKLLGNLQNSEGTNIYKFFKSQEIIS